MSTDSYRNFPVALPLLNEIYELDSESQMNCVSSNRKALGHKVLDMFEFIHDLDLGNLSWHFVFTRDRPVSKLQLPISFLTSRHASFLETRTFNLTDFGGAASTEPLITRLLGIIWAFLVA